MSDNLVSLTQQLGNMHLECSDDEISQLENMMANLNLQNDQSMIPKILDFLNALRSKTPCRVYINWTTNQRPPRCM